MATTLLQQPQHPFNQLNAHYTPGLFDSYTGQPNTSPNAEIQVPSGTAGEQQLPYTSPTRWIASQTLPRRASRSPHVQNRTPIRHSRPDMSRHRSTSRPEVFMAYAQEQVRQVQPDVARHLYVPSAEPGGPMYQPHPYPFHQSTSPYLQQQPYFENPNPLPGYTQLTSQQSPGSASNMYPPSRNDVQVPQIAGAPSSLNPADTMFTQPRTSQLPPMPAVPSNFPPIHQPLESTPNEVDIVGSRQKPQCWDHGCNGRQFSTFSNLLRHQREKSGTATKARCPHCGTEFTRTTARNGHLYGGKCKGIGDGGADEGKSESQENDEVP